MSQSDKLLIYDGERAKEVAFWQPLLDSKLSGEILCLQND